MIRTFRQCLSQKKTDPITPTVKISLNSKVVLGKNRINRHIALVPMLVGKSYHPGQHHRGRVTVCQYICHADIICNPNYAQHLA